MLPKKASPRALRPTVMEDKLLQARLEYLYQRRTLVNDLLRSLEAYSTCASESLSGESPEWRSRIAS